MVLAKARIKSQAVAIYFVLAFALSWGGLLAVGGLSAATWQSDPRLPLMVLAMLAGPSTAALLLSSIAGALAVGFFEELGWTGFAVPTLRRQYSAVATALLVGGRGGDPWAASS